MAYGILIVLVPPKSSWPEGQLGRRDDLLIEAWRQRLTVWEHEIQSEAATLGARSVLSFTPLQQPVIAQTNIWMDDVGDDLAEAMQKATQLALAIGLHGHVIRCVQVLDWAQSR